jgi:hypothetical protein
MTGLAAAGIILFAVVSDLTLGPIKSLIQWVPGSLSLVVNHPNLRLNVCFIIVYSHSYSNYFCKKAVQRYFCFSGK